MEPRIVLIAQYPSQAHDMIREVLSRIGVWIFRRDEDAVWQLREQLQIAHAVLIVFEREKESHNYPDAKEAFDREIVELVEYRKQHQQLQIMTVVEYQAIVPTELKGVATLYFDGVLRPPNLRRIVEFVFDAARAAVDAATKADADMLIARGRIELNRLTLLVQEAELLLIWPLLAVGVTLVGVGLSIPGLLSRLALSDYWLVFGPVIFIVGALTTIYLSRRYKRGRRVKTIAVQLKEELSSILYQLELSRKRKEPLSETSALAEST